MTGIKTRRRASKGNAAGGVGQPVFPEFVASSAKGLPENNGAAGAVPPGTVAGDYIFAWAMGVGSGTCTWSGSGWTSILSYTNGNRVLRVYGKFVAFGDPTSYTPSSSGITGMAGLATYRNVASVHGTVGYVAGGSSIGITFPAGWSGLNVGGRALIFDANDNTNDHPVHTTIEGWCRDLDYRRWHYGGAVFSTIDPVLWKTTASYWSSQGWHAIGQVFLNGGENRPGTLEDHLTVTTRPTLVTTGGIGWNSNLVVPAGLLVDDLLVIIDYRSSSSGFTLGNSEPGWWGIAGLQANGNNHVQAHGTFLKAGESGSRTIRLYSGGDQSRGYAVLRGVNKKAPFMRRLATLGANSGTLASATAGVNTFWLCTMGANIGSGGTNFDSTTGWSTVDEHNRWAPWGAGLYRTVTDGQVISNLAWNVEGSVYALGELVEIRGT